MDQHGHPPISKYVERVPALGIPVSRERSGEQPLMINVEGESVFIRRRSAINTCLYISHSPLTLPQLEPSLHIVEEAANRETHHHDTADLSVSPGRSSSCSPLCRR